MKTYEKLNNMVIRAWNNYLTMPKDREMWEAVYLLLANERDLYREGI